MALSEADATVRLAMWVHAISRKRTRRALFGRSDAEWARMSALAETVDRQDYWRSVAIQSVLCFFVLLVGFLATVLFASLAAWAAIKSGLLPPSVFANNPSAGTTTFFVLFAVGGIATMMGSAMLPPRLAARWASKAFRAKLVSQPGDAELLAKGERRMIRFMVLGIPVALVVLPLMILLIWAALQCLPSTEWLWLLVVLLILPVLITQTMRHRRTGPQAS